MKQLMYAIIFVSALSINANAEPSPTSRSFYNNAVPTPEPKEASAQDSAKSDQAPTVFDRYRIR